MSDVLSEGVDTYTGEQGSRAAMKIYLTEVVENVHISTVPMSTRKKTRYEPVVKTPITCDIIITLWIKEIQIIDDDQKDDFPLWEVHIKKRSNSNF